MSRRSRLRRIGAVAAVAAAVQVATMTAGGAQRPGDSTPRLDGAERAAVDAAIVAAFPGLAGWSLSEGFVGHFADDIDRRLKVDVPGDPPAGRVGRHARFDCVRQRGTGRWRCGDHWQMLWRVERSGSGGGRCRDPLLGLDASRVADEAVILDVVDYFSMPSSANAALEATRTCHALERATLCRPADLSPAQPSRGMPAPDFEVRFAAGPGSAVVVRVNRHCTGAGPCLIEIVGCSRESAN